MFVMSTARTLGTHCCHTISKVEVSIKAIGTNQSNSDYEEPDGMGLFPVISSTIPKCTDLKMRDQDHSKRIPRSEYFSNNQWTVSNSN